MTWRFFGVMLAAFAFLFVAFWIFVEFQTAAVDGWHYSVDTITLRARISDPEDKDLSNPIVFKVVEDIVSVLVFVILGFGLAAFQGLLETNVSQKGFVLEESLKPVEPAAERERPRLKTWQEWLKERDPKMYEDYYGDRADKKLMRWVLDLPPKEEGPKE